MKAKKTAIVGVLTAMALIIGWIEHLLPVSGAVPGIKLGIANITVVFALFVLGRGYAAAVSGAKVLLSALLFGGFSGFIYSVAGAACSYAAMALVSRSQKLSPVGVSAVGGAVHVTAQILIAIAATSTVQLWRITAPIMTVGIITGTLNGLLASMIIERLKGSAAAKGTQI